MDIGVWARKSFKILYVIILNHGTSDKYDGLLCVTFNYVFSCGGPVLFLVSFHNSERYSVAILTDGNVLSF